MALKLSVDTLDGIEETHRALYTEKDGKFVLDVEGVEDTTGLKNALSAERRRADAAEKQRKSWERLGKTPEEIEQLLADQAKLDEERLNKAGEWDKLRNQMNEKHQGELAKKDDALNAMRKRLRGEVIDKAAVAAIAAEKGIPDLLLPHVQRFVNVDDEFNPVVVDAKGDPRVDAKGNPMTIHDLVKEMKASEVYGRAFEGSGQSGGGTPPGGGGGGNPQIKRKSDLKDRATRAQYVEKFGIEAYRALPD